MSGWAFLGQMLASKDADKRQQKEYDLQKQLESQKSVDRASERAANIGAEVENYKKKKDVDLEYADRESVNAAKMELAKFFSSKGIDPQLLKQGDEVFETTRSRYVAEQKAGKSKATNEDVAAGQNTKIKEATFPTELSRLVSQAGEGAFRAGQSKKFAESNPDLLNARMYAEEALPVANLRQKNTISVSPGEYFKQLMSGSPVVDSMYPPITGTGLMQEKEALYTEFGGKRVPTGDFATKNIPPNISPVRRTPLSELNSAAPTNQRIDLLTKQPEFQSLPEGEIGVPNFDGGKISALIKPKQRVESQEEKALREQREAEAALANPLIQRLLSNPYQFNRQNR